MMVVSLPNVSSELYKIESKTESVTVSVLQKANRA